MTAQAAPHAGPKGVFSPMLMGLLAFIGLIAFIAFFAGNAFDTGPRADLDTSPHAASKSAVGFAGAVDLLKRTGHPALVSRGPITSPGADSSVLVVTLDAGMTGSVFDNPLVRRHEGPVLVILPKWATTDSPERFGWVRKRGLLPVPADAWLRRETDAEPEDERTTEEILEDRRRSKQEKLRDFVESARPRPADPSRVSVTRTQGEAPQRLFVKRLDNGGVSALADTGRIDRLQTFAYNPGWDPLIVDQTGRAVLIGMEDEPWFVLSEPDLLNTHGIADIGNARAGAAVLDQIFGSDASYIFDVSLHGLQRSRSFVRQAFEPPFLAATLCAIAAILLLGWHALVRFGRARQEGRAFALGKRALADNQADLIKMTGREHRMGGPYAAVVRDLTARAVGAPRDLSPEELDALMDRMGESGRTSWPFSTLRDDLSKAKDAAELETAAARLHHWRLEMTRERQ